MKRKGKRGSLSQSSRQMQPLGSVPGGGGNFGVPFKGASGKHPSVKRTNLLGRQGTPSGANTTRPDIIKLRKQSKPLTTKSDAAKMVRANKTSKFNKMNKKKDNVAGRTGIVKRVGKSYKNVGKKVVKAGVAGSLVGGGALVNQWINQGPEKKKKKKK